MFISNINCHIFMSNDIRIYTSSFLYSYQVPRYSCQNNFPLPMQLCLYQTDFFIIVKFMRTFINQESLVPSISKRKRESENEPYINNMGPRFQSERGRVLRKMLILSVFTMHPAVTTKLSSGREEKSSTNNP